MLDAYAAILGSSERLGIITLPFNVDKRFADVLEEESKAVRYVMLNSGSKQSAAAERFNPDPDVIVAPGSSSMTSGVNGLMKYTAA